MRFASWILLALLAAATGYGVVHEHLYLQTWDPAGASRFLTYLGVFTAASGLIVWLCPRWLGSIAAVFVLVYTIWWSGPAAPLAVLYFLGSCFMLGAALCRRLARPGDIPTATLLGASVWMFLIWIALHFPINTPWVYGGALLLPYLVFGKRIITIPTRTIPTRFRLDMLRLNMGRSEAAAFAVLLAILLARWLVALKPEVSSDGLSMHLALPMAVANHGRWAFDAGREVWALMPAGAESLYTAVFLLGGETAARLLNFSFLAMIVALVALAARRWVSPAWAWLAAALFVSTPLVEFITGSLFVENVWAALVVAATLALGRYLEQKEPGELTIAGMLLGAALAVKLIAAAFVAPIALLGGVAAIRNRQLKAALPATALLLLLGAPPYVYAYAKTGNPVIPFANTIFKSSYWYTNLPFSDSRFSAKPSWKTPYELTFQSTKFIEGQGGAAGFQYFLLLIPLAVLVRRREQAVLLAVAATSVGIVLIGAPNLRYTYGSLPLFSIAIAWFAAKGPPKAAAAALVLLIGLNLWFTPAAGPYNHDFALFRHADVEPYFHQIAPTRVLIDYLNHAAPGEPVALFSSDTTAGLKGAAFTDSWHHERYWARVRTASSPGAIKVIFDEFGIHRVIAPVARTADFPTLRKFFQVWLEPDGPSAGSLGVFRVREAEQAVPHETGPLAPGSYDDLEDRIEYSGPWYHDGQFPQTWEHTVTYCGDRGAWFRITFTGTAITYVYTAALNRGIGQVLIDGQERARMNMYSKEPEWQSKRRFGDLRPGKHTFEMRVTGEKDERSSETVVDLDAVVIE